MDRSKLESGIRLFLEGLGVDCDPAEIERTPERVALAWTEDLVCGYETDPSMVLTYSPVEPGNGPVIVRHVSLASICVHHLLPFFGVAHVAYVPHRRLAGLSKIGRVVDAHARRLQTQEVLTRQIVDTLQRGLEPHGVLAFLEAEHTCMTLRGVRKEQSRLITVAASGIFETDPEERGRILELLNAGGPAGSSR
jgi:GTP cyclohydrolase I